LAAKARQRNAAYLMRLQKASAVFADLAS
jgi:hypothetical protein